jgi:hypothetical protein
MLFVNPYGLRKHVNDTGIIASIGSPGRVSHVFDYQEQVRVGPFNHVFERLAQAAVETNHSWTPPITIGHLDTGVFLNQFGP